MKQAKDMTLADTRSWNLEDLLAELSAWVKLETPTPTPLRSTD